MWKRAGFRAALACLFALFAASAEAQIRLEYGFNRQGFNYYKRIYASTAESCAAVCNNEAACRAFVWYQAGGQCRLQQHEFSPASNVCCVSGVKRVAYPAPQPPAGYPDGCAVNGNPRASLHFVNRGPQPLRVLVNGYRLRDVGPYGQNAERYALPVGRNMVQIVLPNGQYMTKYVIVVNKGAATCTSWVSVTYP